MADEWGEFGDGDEWGEFGDDVVDDVADVGEDVAEAGSALAMDASTLFGADEAREWEGTALRDAVLGMLATRNDVVRPLEISDMLLDESMTLHEHVSLDATQWTQMVADALGLGDLRPQRQPMPYKPRRLSIRMQDASPFLFQATRQTPLPSMREEPIDLIATLLQDGSGPAEPTSPSSPRDPVWDQFGTLVAAVPREQTDPVLDELMLQLPQADYMLSLQLQLPEPTVRG